MVIAIVVIILTGIASVIFMNSLYFGFFAMLLLTFGCGRFFFPTTFKLDEEGVTETYLGINKQQPWSYFKRFVEKDNGVFLSPFEKPHWLNRYRAWYIYPKNKKMLDFVADKF
ncbi:hypothetical protein JW877_00740 [bacterium]|nr:hypothetical protein [bacterium]